MILSGLRAMKTRRCFQDFGRAEKKLQLWDWKRTKNWDWQDSTYWLSQFFRIAKFAQRGTTSWGGGLSEVGRQSQPQQPLFHGGIWPSGSLIKEPRSIENSELKQLWLSLFLFHFLGLYWVKRIRLAWLMMSQTVQESERYHVIEKYE